MQCGKIPFNSLMEEAYAIDRRVDAWRDEHAKFTTKRASHDFRGGKIIGSRVRYDSMHRSEASRLALLIADGIKCSAWLKTRYSQLNTKAI